MEARNPRNVAQKHPEDSKACRMESRGKAVTVYICRYNLPIRRCFQNFVNPLVRIGSVVAYYDRLAHCRSGTNMKRFVEDERRLQKVGVSTRSYSP